MIYEKNGLSTYIPTTVPLLTHKDHESARSLPSVYHAIHQFKDTNNNLYVETVWHLVYNILCSVLHFHFRYTLDNIIS